MGLPLTRFGKEKEAFIKYLSRNREVTFKYEKKQYHITIERISVYPQCFAAVASQINDFPPKVLVVDIGSWTVDLMPIINQSPDESVCVTKNSGIITCIQQMSNSPVGCMVKLENCFNGMDGNIEFLEKKLEQYRRDMEQAKAEYEKPFAYEEELKSKTARQFELNIMLDLENKPLTEENTETMTEDRYHEAGQVAEQEYPYGERKDYR